MLTEKDKTTIREISKKYSAKRVLLFGSGIDPKIESSDIDIAVEGISHGDFFRYYGELLFALTKPVDVIDLACVLWRANGAAKPRPSHLTCAG